VHGRTHCLACKQKRRTQANTGTPKSLRHSLRNGFTAYSVLSPGYRYSIHTFWSLRVVPYLMRRKSSRPMRMTLGPGFP
jgi:hypothetical protein